MILNDSADIPVEYAPTRNRFTIGRLVGIALTNMVVKIAEPNAEIPKAVNLETMLSILHYCLKGIGYTIFHLQLIFLLLILFLKSHLILHDVL